VHLVGIGKADQGEVAERLAGELEQRGLSVLLDDRRKVSPGVAFKDAELLGVPTSVVVGKGLADGTVEVKDRRSGEVRSVPLDEVVDAVVAEVTAGGVPAGGARA
jgi:prolyl-tRNA synthetase